MSTDVLAETDFPTGLRERTGKVYITAPRTVDVEPLRAALRANGLHPIALEDVPVAGTLADVVREACLMSDFVVAVLDPELDRNVMYEIGVADGLQRPVLTFAAPGKEGELTEQMKGQHAYMGPLTTPDKLGERLAGIGTDVGNTQPQPPTIPTAQPLGEVADWFREQFREAAKQGKVPLSLIHQFMSSVRLGGTSKPHEGQGRIDLAGWSPEWEPWVANPLLIQFRGPQTDSTELELVKRYADALGDHALGWGLLIASSFSPEVLRTARSVAPYVLLITYDDLFDRLKRMSFPRIVVALRNQRVHGEG